MYLDASKRNWLTKFSLSELIDLYFTFYKRAVQVSAYALSSRPVCSNSERLAEECELLIHRPFSRLRQTDFSPYFKFQRACNGASPKWGIVCCESSTRSRGDVKTTSSCINKDCVIIAAKLQTKKSTSLQEHIYSHLRLVRKSSYESRAKSPDTLKYPTVHCRNPRITQNCKSPATRALQPHSNGILSWNHA